jgi:NAD(P)H dehydrogenase (quinone)
MILVTGSTGGLGSAILAELAAAGVGAQGSSREERDDRRRIDFDRPETVRFAGVDTLVLVSAGEAEDDVVTARHDAAITAAERDGVTHIVYTSVTTAGDHLAFALAHRRTEQRLRRSPVASTILRNGLYAELFGSLLQWSSTSERLESAFGDGALSAVGRADLAAAAAAVACSPERHVGRVYELVGPPITAADVASELDIELQQTSLRHRRQQLLTGGGLKPFQPAMLMSIYSAVRHGFLDKTSDDLVALLGRPPANTVTIAAAAARASTARPR